MIKIKNHKIITDNDISRTSIVIYLLLFQLSQNQKLHITNKKIGDILNISRSAVYQSLKELEKKRYIKKELISFTHGFSIYLF